MNNSRKDVIASKNNRVESPSPVRRIDDGMELKHFKKSKLFQKFIKEASQGDHPPQKEKKQVKVQTPPKIESTRSIYRNKSDQFNVSEQKMTKSSASEANLRTKTREISSQHDRDVQFIGDGEKNRLRHLPDPYSFKQSLPLSREESIALESRGQSINLNYNSSSQYVPVHASPQPNQMISPRNTSFLNPIFEESLAQPESIATEQKRVPESSDMFLMKAKLVETTKALERENETNKVLIEVKLR